MRITTKKELRRYFFETHPEVSKKRVKLAEGHIEYVCDTRLAFSNFVDQLYEDGIITEELAKIASL